MPLRTPVDVHGVRTPEEYRSEQARYLRKLQRARPSLNLADPRVVAVNPPVRLVHGKWVVMCAEDRGGEPCGDPVSVHPDWQLGCCFRCGAIYEDVAMPDNVDAIASALADQPRHTQNWSPGDDL